MHVLRQDIISRLKNAALGVEAEMDIADVALLLAQTDLPNKSLGPCHDHLARLSADLSCAIKEVENVQDMAAALSDVLFEGHGYSGDIETYDDIQNANLIRVIERRKGLPVALGILIVHMSRAQGWEINGLKFPGHFLLRLHHKGEHVIIDPFRRARRLTSDNLVGLVNRMQGVGSKIQATYLKSVSDRDILLRLQNNIKMRALAADDTDHAVQILETMTLISPESANVVAELAALEAEVGNFKSALERLTSFLEQCPQHPEKAQITALAKTLNQRLN